MKPEINGALIVFGLLLLTGVSMEIALGSAALAFGIMGILRFSSRS